MTKGIETKLQTFFSKYPSLAFRKGSVLFEAGKEPTGIYYIESGIVRRYWIFENGTEITFNLYKPHSFLPMSWAIGDVPSMHTYEALTDIKVRKAPKKDVLEFLQKEPDIVYDLLRRVYIGMEGLWTHIESLTTGNSFIKLASSLLILAKRFGKQDAHNTITVELKMSEQDIANYAGMSRETASREFQKLKKEHIASFEKGTVFIEDMKKLENLLLM